MSIDCDWVRAQFPALHGVFDGKPAVFFDGPGGTQVPACVLDAIREYLVRANANHGGTFETSRRNDASVRAARHAMADLLGCAADQIVFGANMTTLTFAVSRAIARELQAGDEVLVTTLDHDANVSPWRALGERGVVIRQVAIREEDCTLDLDDFAAKLTARTRLVAVGYASNAVGTVNPLQRIAHMAHAAGALVYVDAVHYAPHGLIDVRALDCDFLVCSAYKFFGPHVGVLYGKPQHLEHFSPYKVRAADDCVPERWETGTQPFELIAALPAAVDYLAEVGRRCAPGPADRRAAIRAAFHAISCHERDLVSSLIDGLIDLPGVRLFGIRDPARFHERCPTVSIRIEGRDSRAVAQALAERGIFVWDGHFYAVSLAERLGVTERGGLLRIGLVHYNTEIEVQRLLQGLADLLGAE